MVKINNNCFLGFIQECAQLYIRHKHDLIWQIITPSSVSSRLQVCVQGITSILGFVKAHSKGEAKKMTFTAKPFLGQLSLLPEGGELNRYTL